MKYNGLSSKIGRMIHETRKSKGLTLEDVGKILGVHKTTAGKYETGDIKNIPIEKVENFCKLFGITPNELFDWEEETKSNAPPESHADEIAQLKETAETMARCANGFLQQVNELCEKLGKE